MTTARINELISIAEQRMAWEVMRHHRERARLLGLRSVRLGPLEAQIERTNLAAQLLAEAEKEQDLTKFERLADARHPETYVRSRRLTEAERRRAQASRCYAEEKKRLGAEQQHVAAVELGLQALDKVTKMRVRRAYAHGRRRLFAYWASLVRHHPDSAEVNERCVPFGPSLPTWTDLDQEGNSCEG